MCALARAGRPAGWPEMTAFRSLRALPPAPGPGGIGAHPPDGLRILLLTDQHFSPVREGMSTVMTELARCIPARNLVCLTGVKNARPPPGEGRGVLRTTLFDRGSRWGKVFQLLWTALRLRVRWAPQVIVADSCWSGNIALLMSRILGIPLLTLAHGREILRLKSQRWPKPRESLARSEAIVATSEYTRRLVLAAGFPPEKLKVMYLGADPEIFYPLNPGPVEAIKARYGLGGKRVILTAGNLFLRKGQDTVIEALATLRRRFPEIVYLIAGEGPDEAVFRKLAASLSLQDEVRFLGEIKDWAKLRELYNICDIFVMDSRMDPELGSEENFGIAFLEAGACGKPVIGSRSGGIPEAILDGVTGLLVRPESQDDLARAISALIGDPSLARRLGEAGRRRVVEELNWRQAGIRMEKICREVIAERNRRKGRD